MRRGDFVKNVHPCGHRDEQGVVLGPVDELGMVSVQTGLGSHTYGPAVNWGPLGHRPGWTLPAVAPEVLYPGFEDWLRRHRAMVARVDALELERHRCYSMHGDECDICGDVLEGVA